MLSCLLQVTFCVCAVRLCVRATDTLFPPTTGNKNKHTHASTQCFFLDATRTPDMQYEPATMLEQRGNIPAAAGRYWKICIVTFFNFGIDFVPKYRFSWNPQLQLISVR